MCFRKLPIQEFHFSRILQEIGLTEGQVTFLVALLLQKRMFKSQDINSWPLYVCVWALVLSLFFGF